MPQKTYRNALELMDDQTLNVLLGMDHPGLNIKEQNAMQVPGVALADAIRFAVMDNNLPASRSNYNPTLADRLLTVLMNKKNTKDQPRPQLGAPIFMRPAGNFEGQYTEWLPDQIGLMILQDLQSLQRHPDLR